MVLALVACGSKPSDENNNTDSTAFPTKTMTIVCLRPDHQCGE